MIGRARITSLLRAQLTQGATPGKLALTLGLGAALGVFPVLGATTALCLGAGLWLRLNQPLLQLVNYLAYPLQLALLIPFYRAGERVFGAAPVPLLSVADLVQRFQDGPGQFVLDYARVGLYGVVAWALVAPLLVGLCYFALRPPLEGLAQRLRRPAAASAVDA